MAVHQALTADQWKQTRDLLKQWQYDVRQLLLSFDVGSQFDIDRWNYQAGEGGGETCVLVGEHIEKAGVNFSEISGHGLPTAALAERYSQKQLAFKAMGVSIVVHPKNPHVPTSHANMRLMAVYQKEVLVDWWVGGGFDLTPFYPVRSDCVHWHRAAKRAADVLSDDAYGLFKKACDDYFYLPHRQEARGIGGLFFDHLNARPLSDYLALMQAVAQQYVGAYGDIFEARYQQPYTEQQRHFQCYRRGRYVEFNLLYDRGTQFGLQSRGRAESILMSLPPLVEWHYQPVCELGSAEAKLLDYLKLQSWL